VDPVTLVVAALAAGASTGLGEVATAAVKDAYAALRSLLSARLGRGRASEVVEEHAADPDTYDKPVRKVIGESGVADDPEVLAAAQRLMQLTDEAGSAAGKYTIDARGARIGAIGDHATGTYHERA
jgi:hypothetical protein